MRFADIVAGRPLLPSSPTDVPLHDGDERFMRAFAHAPIGMALISLDPATPGRVLHANYALCRMLGYSEAEMLVTDFQSLTHPDDLQNNVALFAQALSGERPGYEIEKRFVRADGSDMWALVQAAVARDADDTPMYGISQVHDITERRAAEAALRQSQGSLARTQRLAKIGSWCWSSAEDRFTWSEGVSHVFGPPDAIAHATGADFMRVVHPGDRERVQTIIEAAVNGRVPGHWEYRAVNRDGQEFHMYAWGEVVVGPGGKAVRIEGYVQDVTERRRAEDQAERLRHDNERILNAAGEGIFRLDGDGRATFVNPAAARMLGYAPAELVGSVVHDVFHHSHEGGGAHPHGECPITLTARDGEIRRVDGDVFWRRDGSALPVEYTSAPLREGARLTGAVVVFSDVTERRELQARLRHLADHDPLTGLLNRRRLEQMLGECLADETSSGALVLLDLDHFKFVNDSFGHSAGDDLIRSVAAVLSSEVTGDDILARLGGDEFAVLLDGADEAQARAAADRFLGAIERARPSGLRIGGSVGVTSFAPGRRGSPSDLLVAADIALYQAKGSGRGQVVVYSGKPGFSLTWVQRIRAALDEDRLVLHAQPIVDLPSGEIARHELLVRMLDERGEFIPPDSFLPTAETFGLIGDIDRWVLARGVELAARGMPVHVNLSGSSVGSGPLLDELATMVRESGIDPRLLVLELTETHAVANMGDARRFAQGLRAIGCKLALDDFGTGFGSFTYLKHLPADYLKIDMEFVRDVAHNLQDRRVVESIVGIAERFGPLTIAEGVEDEACLAVLRELGVDYAQGFHLGRPGPLPELR